MTGAEESADQRRCVLLVGSFRSMVNEGDDGPFGGQGGFVDTLAPAPYSLANAYLKTFAEADPAIAARYRIELLNLAEPLDIEDEREEVVLTAEDLQAILDHAPAIVGFSTYCWNVDAVREAAARLRRIRPDLRIVVGGRATDGDPEELLATLAGVDALIVGEGEVAFREILRRDAENLRGIPGVVHRDGLGGISSGGPPEIVSDMDDIPSPWLTGALSPPPHGIMMELSRGCLHACGYCTWNSHKRLRLVSPARLEAEIRWVRDHGHRHVTATDSALNYDTEGLVQTIDAIRRADPEGEVRFTYNIRHDHVSEAQLQALSRLPTHMVLLGIETLTPAAMGGVSREEVDLPALEQTLADIAGTIRPPVVSIVLGLPGDDEEGFRRTLDTLMRWTEPRGTQPRLAEAVLVSLLQVYRGSGLWRRREELGLRFRERGIPYLLQSPTWPPEALARAKAHLVERMSEDPERLKAAEAIVLMEAHGGVSPWHTRRRIQAVLSEWEPGTRRGGWTLEKLGLVRDTGRGVLARFRFERGGGLRLLFERRSRETNGALSSRYYSLRREPAPGPRPPEEACRRLEQEVVAMVRRGEERLAAQAAEARRRASGG